MAGLIHSTYVTSVLSITLVPYTLLRTGMTTDKSEFDPELDPIIAAVNCRLGLKLQWKT